jgi:hypothetical protein
MKYGFVLSCVMAVALATVAQAAAPVPILGPAGGVNAPMEDCTGCVGAPNDARDDVYYNTVDYGTVSWVQHPTAFLGGQDYTMTEGVLNDPSFDGNVGNIASPTGTGMAAFGQQSHIWPVNGSAIAPMTMRYRASKPGADYQNRVESVLQPNGGEWILSLHLGLDAVAGTSTVSPNAGNTKLFEAGGPAGDIFAIKPVDGRSDTSSFFIETCGSEGCASAGNITVEDGSFHHYVVHHKDGKLDFWIDDALVLDDAEGGNAASGIKNLQLGGGGNNYPHTNLTVDNLVLGIPEPATMGLLALSSMLVLARRRR